MAKKSFVSAGFALAAVIWIGMGSVSAQTESLPDAGAVREERGAVMATVNIYEAEMSSSEGHTLDISFILSNRTGIQSGVRHGIELRSSESGELVDRMIVAQAEKLGKNEALKKVIAYDPPEFLTGKYQVWVASENESGLPLARVMAGEIDLAGEENGIELSKCRLQVGDGKSFPLIPPISLQPGTGLRLLCEIENASGSDVAITPHVQVNRRSVFGKSVAEKDEQSIAVENGERQEMIVSIPTDQSPQAYVATIDLSNQQGVRVAPPIIFDYVVLGSMATIQNITLNQESYAQGDTAEVDLFWTAWAGGISPEGLLSEEQGGERIRIAMLDGDGQLCAKEFVKGLDRKELKEKVQIPIETDCRNGKMAAAILDQKGSTLDEMTVEFEKTGALVPGEPRRARPGILPTIYLFAGALFLLGLVAIYFKKGRSGNLALLVLLIGTAGLLIAADKAQADTWSGPPYSSYRPVYYGSLDKTSYCRGTTIRATGSADTWGSYTCPVTFSTSANINGNNQSLGSTVFSGPCDGSGTGSSGSGSSVTKSYTAQNNVGSYNAAFNGHAVYSSGSGGGDHTSDAGHNIGYSVVDCSPPPPPVNGACGSAQGGTYSSAPTSGRCNSGNPSSPALNATQTRWLWTCSGSNGGSSASCWANNNPAPIGNHDGADNSTCTTSGWALDRSNLNQSLQIHIYRDGPAGSGVFVGAYTANLSRPDVQTAYGTPMASYGFSASLKGTSVDNGQAHNLYAYAIDIPGGNNPLLGSSPRAIHCSSVPSCTGSCPVTGGVSCGSGTDTGLSVSTPWTYSEGCDGSAKCQCDCPNGTCRSGDRCIARGTDVYTCVKVNPSCSGQECTTASGTAICKVDNNCGTSYENPSGGKCGGTVDCVADTQECACPEGWRELQP